MGTGGESLKGPQPYGFIGDNKRCRHPRHLRGRGTFVSVGAYTRPAAGRLNRCPRLGFQLTAPRKAGGIVDLAGGVLTQPTRCWGVSSAYVDAQLGKRGLYPRGRFDCSIVSSSCESRMVQRCCGSEARARALFRQMYAHALAKTEAAIPARPAEFQ